MFHHGNSGVSDVLHLGKTRLPCQFRAVGQVVDATDEVPPDLEPVDVGGVGVIGDHAGLLCAYCCGIGPGTLRNRSVAMLS